MSVGPRPPRRPLPPRRRRRGRLVLGILLLVLVFGFGIAVGQALEDNPSPGKTRTFLRTFEPAPATRPATTGK